MAQKDFVLQEMGRLVGFWRALKKPLEDLGSYHEVDDLLIPLHDEEFCKLIAKEWRRLTVKFAKSFDPQVILENLRSSIVEQLYLLKESHDVSKGMQYPNILTSLSWQPPRRAKPVDFELWVPRREMTVDEAHRILIEQSFIAPATSMDLLSFVFLHGSNNWSSDYAKVDIIYATASLLKPDENVVLAVYGTGSSLSLTGGLLLKPYIVHQTKSTIISTSTAILVRRLPK